MHLPVTKTVEAKKSLSETKQPTRITIFMMSTRRPLSAGHWQVLSGFYYNIQNKYHRVNTHYVSVQPVLRKRLTAGYNPIASCYQTIEHCLESINIAGYSSRSVIFRVLWCFVFTRLSHPKLSWLFCAGPLATREPATAMVVEVSLRI